MINRDFITKYRDVHVRGLKPHSGIKHCAFNNKSEYHLITNRLAVFTCAYSQTVYFLAVSTLNKDSKTTTYCVRVTYAYITH